MKPGVKRRDFLSKILAGWSLIVSAPVLVAIARFVTPPRSNEMARESIKVAEIGDIATNTAKIVRFNREPVIVVHTAAGQFKAFSARCTHLGCIVQFKSADGLQGFECHCHGSEFDISGRNISGPAPRPLTPLKVSVDATSIVVTRV